MTKRILLGLVLTFVALLVAAFLLLDFRALSAQTNVESQVSRFSFGYGEGGSLPGNQPLTVYVDAREELREALVPALSDALADNGYVGAVTGGDLPPATGEGSVLVVTVEPDRLLWTPVYSRANLDVFMAYASDGEVDWIDDDVVSINNEDGPGPTTRMRGDFQIDNSAYGVISGPGYMHYLSAEIAGRINTTLQTQLDAAEPA